MGVLTRRARADETWAGLTAPVVTLDEDGFGGTRYEIPVECWVVEEQKPPAPAEPSRPRLTEWKPVRVDPDGVPVLEVGR